MTLLVIVSCWEYMGRGNSVLNSLKIHEEKPLICSNNLIYVALTGYDKASKWDNRQNRLLQPDIAIYLIEQLINNQTLQSHS